MKKLMMALALALLPASALAQTASVQQSPTRLDAGQNVATSASSAATITITPPASQFVYLTGLDITNCAGTAVTAAAPLTISTTNLGGAAWLIGTGSTAGLCQPSPTAGSWPLPLKSATPGTAITFVLPTFTTNQTIRVTAYYYFAP